MIQNALYKHLYCQDVAFEPWTLKWLERHHHQTNEKEWYVEAAGAWHNIAHKRMFFVASETIYIKYNDLCKWREYKHA